MIRCRNGHPNPDGTTYCEVCYVYIDASAQPVEPEPTPPPPPPPPPEPEPAPAAPNVALAPSVLTAAPGSDVAAEVQVRNPGGVADEYVIEVSGEAASWASVDPWLLFLAPGAAGTARVTFRPGASAPAPGELPFAVSVTSKLLPGQPAAADGVLELAAPARAAPPPPPPPPPPAPTPIESVGSVRGIVRGLEERAEGGTARESPETVFTFRVEIQDASGYPVALVPVEMRALSFRGALSDGDFVEIDERWKRGRTLEPRQVSNLTTGGRFRAKGSRGRRRVIGCLVFLVIAGAMLAVFFYVAERNGLFEQLSMLRSG